MLLHNLSLQLLQCLEEIIIRLQAKELLFTLISKPEIKIELGRTNKGLDRKGDELILLKVGEEAFL